MGDETPVQLYPPWRQAVEEFRKKGFTYGDVIPHSWFYEALGIEEPNPDAVTLRKGRRLELEKVDQFKDLRLAILKEEEMWLESVTSFGYRVLPPSECTEAAYRKFVKAVRKATHLAWVRLTHVPQGRLTEDEKRKNHDAIAKMSMIRGLHRKALGHDASE